MWDSAPSPIGASGTIPRARVSATPWRAVALLGEPELLLHTARFVLADPPRRQQSLYQEFTPRLQHCDADIREVQIRLHAALHEPHSVEALARAAAMHPRTFQRRFKEATGLTATEYIQTARIAKARESLELTTDPVARISRSVGYLDVSNFRRLFQRATGVTPSEYRNWFGIATRPASSLSRQDLSRRGAAPPPPGSSRSRSRGSGRELRAVFEAGGEGCRQ